MNRPSFFIVGAPKCGTTALSEYLREHQQISFAVPKEPHYFTTDLENRRFVKTEPDYLACFPDAQGDDVMLGEGSVMYLYSKDAISNILDFDPQAKIIVMVRNPLKMVVSLFHQYRYNFHEEVATLEEGWSLQEARSKGQHIPRHCPEPSLLQYREVCALGSQVARVKSLVPEAQLKIIVFDDFVSDTRGVYEDVIRFLGLASDNRQDFPKINERKSHRSGLIASLTQRPPQKLVQLNEKIKRVIGIERLGLVGRLRSANQAGLEPDPLSAELRAELKVAFEPEIAKLEAELGRDLSAWRQEG